jgi:hypothetical protein
MIKAMSGRHNRRKRGVATIELAIILPVALLFLMGAIDFGRIYYEAITVASAARSGTSYGSLRNDLSTDTARIKQLGEEDSEDLSEISVTVERFCECANGSQVGRGTVCAEGAPRVHLKVTAQKSFDLLFSYPGIPNPVTIQRIAYMRAR